jgi:hypothetical protein
LFLTNGREVVTEKPFHLVTPDIAKSRRQEVALDSIESESDATQFDSDSLDSEIEVESVNESAVSSSTASDPAAS